MEKDVLVTITSVWWDLEATIAKRESQMKKTAMEEVISPICSISATGLQKQLMTSVQITVFADIQLIFKKHVLFPLQSNCMS